MPPIPRSLAARRVSSLPAAHRFPTPALPRRKRPNDLCSTSIAPAPTPTLAPPDGDGWPQPEARISKESVTEEHSRPTCRPGAKQQPARSVRHRFPLFEPHKEWGNLSQTKARRIKTKRSASHLLLRRRPKLPSLSGHGVAVEFVDRSADKAGLVVLAVSSSVGPGELMSAAPLQESLEQAGLGSCCGRCGGHVVAPWEQKILRHSVGMRV